MRRGDADPAVPARISGVLSVLVMRAAIMTGSTGLCRSNSPSPSPPQDYRVRVDKVQFRRGLIRLFLGRTNWCSDTTHIEVSRIVLELNPYPPAWYTQLLVLRLVELLAERLREPASYVLSPTLKTPTSCSLVT